MTERFEASPVGSRTSRRNGRRRRLAARRGTRPKPVVRTEDERRAHRAAQARRAIARDEAATLPGKWHRIEMNRARLARA